MKFLGLLGSLAFIIYVVGVLSLTFHNISKTLFGHTYQHEPFVRFSMRQIIIILWPLVLASEEGRHALYVIWTGKNDRAIPGREDLNV